MRLRVLADSAASSGAGGRAVARPAIAVGAAGSSRRVGVAAPAGLGHAGVGLAALRGVCGRRLCRIRRAGACVCCRRARRGGSSGVVVGRLARHAVAIQVIVPMGARSRLRPDQVGLRSITSRARPVISRSPGAGRWRSWRFLAEYPAGFAVKTRSTSARIRRA